MVTLGVAWAWLLVRRRTERRLWIAAATCVAVWLMVSAVQTLPTIEYGRQALRWVGTAEPLTWTDKVPYIVHAEYSLQARSLFGIVFPGFAIHASPFVGIAALLLAVGAVWRLWKSLDVRLLSLVAAVALVLALGKDTPLHWLAYRFIPMVEKARYPAMAIAIAECAMAALAALAFSVPVKLLRQLAVPAAIAGVAAAALYFAHWGHPTLVTAAVALAMAALLRFERAVPAAVLVLIVAEAVSYPPPILREREFPGSCASLIASQADIATFLKSRPGWFRVEFNEDDVPYNFGDFYGVEQFGGYGPGMSVRLNRILGERTTGPRYGVRYYAGKAAKTPAQVEVFRSASGVKVFENPGVGEPLSVWRDAACSGTDKLRVVARTSEESVFEAELACPGLVVAGDPYYRGWRATVDGRRTPIQEFVSDTRAVRVASGDHRIEFRYRPLPVYLGAALTICGLLLTAALRLKAV